MILSIRTNNFYAIFNLSHAVRHSFLFFTLSAVLLEIPGVKIKKHEVRNKMKWLVCWITKKKEISNNCKNRSELNFDEKNSNNQEGGKLVIYMIILLYWHSENKGGVNFSYCLDILYSVLMRLLTTYVQHMIGVSLCFCSKILHCSQWWCFFF